MTRLVYLGSNPKDLNDLAELLAMEVSELQECISLSKFGYKKLSQRKKNGGFRIVYSPNDVLKRTQKSLLKNILDKLDVPPYIQSTKGRDYISNARLHTRKGTLIKEDIKDFFPSVRSCDVLKMWLNLFGFSNDVSEALTLLTTYKGVLPQGAPTSTAVANFYLFDTEPLIYNEFAGMGFTYSRYVDDLSVSSNRILVPREIRNVQNILYRFLKENGLRANKSKSKVYKSSERMEVHGINVNSSRPTRTKEYRNNMRAAVHNCEKCYLMLGGSHPQYIELYNSLFGQLIELERMNNQEAKKLLDRLNNIKPNFTI